MSTEPQTYTIYRDDERPLRFSGTRIAAASSSPDQSRWNFSGHVGISESLELYQTRLGDYVATRTCVSQWRGDHDTHGAIVSSDREDILEFFEFGRLAMEIYTAAGWDIAEDLDALA